MYIAADMISHVLCILEIMLCINQGRTWPNLIKEWTKVEQRMTQCPPFKWVNVKVKLLVYSYFLGAICKFTLHQLLINNFIYYVLVPIANKVWKSYIVKSPVPWRYIAYKIIMISKKSITGFIVCFSTYLMSGLGLD